VSTLSVPRFRRMALAICAALAVSACAAAPVAPEPVPPAEEPAPAPALRAATAPLDEPAPAPRPEPRPEPAATTAAISPPRVWVIWAKEPPPGQRAAAIGLARWKADGSFDFALADNMAGFLHGEMRKAAQNNPSDPGAALDDLLLVQMRRNTGGMVWAEINPRAQATIESMRPYTPPP
jgi:hypothetical protein